MKNDFSIDDVSAFVCTYNEEKNIAACITSIQDAIGGNRIIVVDSGTDKTAEIAQNMGATVIKSEKGLALQRQVGIDYCDTKFHLIVDADDRLEKSCVRVLLKDMKEYKYDSVQARLRVNHPKSYCQKGMDVNWRYCICIPGPTNMTGRPALYKTEVIKKVNSDIAFKNTKDEDTAMAIKMEQLGYKQGIGHGVAYRVHPMSLKENIFIWKAYGRGDANIARRYPHKKWAIIRHDLYEYPIKRSWLLIKNGVGKYCGFTIGMGLVRFVSMVLNLRRGIS